MMRRIRTIATAAMLSAALFGASGGIASGAAGSSYRDEVPITGTSDDPLVASQTYTLSYNSSGVGTKVSGGFSLSGANGFFLGGKTTLICTYPVDDPISTRIINKVNPPKKGGVTGVTYLVININSADEETVDVIRVGEDAPTC